MHETIRSETLNQDSTLWHVHHLKNYTHSHKLSRFLLLWQRTEIKLSFFYKTMVKVIQSLWDLRFWQQCWLKIHAFCYITPCQLVN